MLLNIEYRTRNVELSSFFVVLLGSLYARSEDGNQLIIFMNQQCKIDKVVKSLLIVMPDLIRHPEPIEFTGFRLPPE